MKHPLIIGLTLLTMGCTYWWGNDLLISFESPTPSQIVDNRIVRGKRLPVEGVNFKSYSRFWSLMGRTHVHDRVRCVVLDAYHSLEITYPGIQFIYGETGWKNGGNFWPHKTHRLGLSVDFMTPLRDRVTHEPVSLSTYPWTLYGYNVRFDSLGRSSSYQIDFLALIEHLAALDQACHGHSLKIKRVILDPALQECLSRQSTYDKIKNIPFLKGQAWFPHDGHYHVDFELMDS